MQPNLDNLKKKIEENRDLIDRIRLKLPGFKGYVEKAEAYDADKLIRSLIVDRLKSMKGEVTGAMVELEKKEVRRFHAEFESLINKIEAFIRKCEYTDFGSSASLSGIALSEDDRNRLLEYDWRLISGLDELETETKNLRSSSQDAAGDVIAVFSGKLRQFEERFNERKNVILEVL